MEPSKQPPKGRGERFREKLAALRLQDEKSKPASEPPRPRGRAALIAKVLEMKQAKVGASSSHTFTVVGEPTALSPTTAASCEIEEEPKSFRGTSGKTVNIAANYIRLKVEKNFGIFEYRVDFEPSVDSKGMRSKLLYMCLPKATNVQLFDGGNMLFLPTKLPQPSTNFVQNHPIDDIEITVTITFVKQKSPGDCLHVYNILFKKIMYALLYSPIGRKYFSFETKIIIPQHKLEIYPGYAVAVDEKEDGLLVCLDAQHRLVRSQNVLELLIELKLAFGHDFKKAAEKRLISSTVITRYNNRTYVIDDIIWEASPQSTFETVDGRVLSYVEYYKKQHDITIKDVNQPLLLHRKTVTDAKTLEKVNKQLCFIPELCFITGLTEDSKRDFSFMRDIAQHLRITPNQRVSALRKYLENVKGSSESQKILKDWGLRLDSTMIDLQARVLDPETILFGEGARAEDRNANFDGAIKRNKVIGPVDMENWMVIYSRRDDSVVREFVEVMVRLGPGMGCRIKEPRVLTLNDDRTDTFVKCAKQNISGSLQIIVFVIPSNRSDLYSAIKKVCCVMHPIASQVVLSYTLKKKQMRSITQKIALQMNCKLGGALWALRFPFKSWMICGIDVYHNVVGGKKSVCALVSSLNEGLYQWHSSCAFQEKEIGDHYKRLFANALVKYRQNRGDFPSTVVVYRDGVGDGQLDHCLKYEVADFERVLQEMKIEANLCFVVVQKRINTRIFLENNGGYVNPQPGTILDYGTTRKAYADFFLVAQHVNQGTVTPTHYVVLKNTCNMEPDRLQRLTFKMCHLYYNWPGTIRAPAPCQYAHKLAYLVGENIGQKPSDALSDFLYYL